MLSNGLMDRPSSPNSSVTLPDVMDLASFRFALVLALVLLVSAIPTSAQETDEDEQLYEIAPREIEIRGQLEVNLPSLERQPLRGLAPAAKVPTLPPSRKPYIGTYKRTLEDIPQRLPEPVSTASTLAVPTNESRASLAVGGGRYFSRVARGRVSVPLSDSETLNFKADYEGSEGHEAFSDVDSQYDNATTRLQLESRREQILLSADVHGFVDSYTLYGVQPSARIPDRVGFSGGATVELRTRGSVPATLGVSYDQTEYETGTRTFDEDRFEAHGSVEVPIPDFPLRLEGAFSSSGLDGGSATDGDVVTFDGGAQVALLQSPTLTLDAGARLLTFDGVTHPASATPGNASANFVAPFAEGQWTPTSALTLYAHWKPRLKSHGLASMMATNPFVVHGPTLLPTLETTNAEAGARFSVGSVELNAFGGYRYAPSYRYFAPADPSSSPFAAGVFEPEYDSAEILRGGASIAFNGLRHVQASARVLVREGTLVDTDRAIPNFAPVVGEGALTFTFADRNAFIEVAGTVESPRYVDRREQTEVGTYADVDVKASYSITPTIDVLARVENIGSGTLERWQRYPRPPTVVSTGLRLRW